MPIAVVIVNAQGRIVYVTAKLEDMFGYPHDELLGKMVEVLMPERYHHVHVLHREGYMHHGHARNMGSGMDLAGKRKDGSEFPLEAGLSTLRLEEETFVVVTVTDVTKRKEIEMFLARQVDERTREVERRHAIAESLRHILSTLISNRSLVDSLNFIVGEAARLLATDYCAVYSRDERLGTLEREVTRGTLGHEVEERLVQHLKGQARIFHEPMVVSPDTAAVPAFNYTNGSHSNGEQILPHTFVTIPIRGETQIYGLLLFNYPQHQMLSDQDVDLAVRMADHILLAFANAHLRAQIETSAVAAERSRIARDLHDAVTQTLFSASIIAGILPTIWQRNQDEGRKRLEELRELTRGALAEMRTLLLELRPAKLVEVDLADLLRQLAEAISGRARVPVTLQTEGCADISADVKVALYRVAQEALNNIAKHAQAHVALVKLRCTPDEITLSVSDDGVGFIFESIAPQHLGLGIMRERADAIGASLSVRSAPNEGTTVEVHWRPANSATTNDHAIEAGPV